MGFELRTSFYKVNCNSRKILKVCRLIIFFKLLIVFMINENNQRRKSILLQDLFARNVRIERTKMGVTQEDLAALCGYHRTYIGSIERGERNITLATVEALASAFGINPYKLLVDNDE